MSCLFTLPYRMAHFYTIHRFEENSMFEFDDSGYFTLYSTFDKACDAMNKMILDYIAQMDWIVVFDEPDREPLRKEIETQEWTRYYYLGDNRFTICKATVVE